jgi:hypothetical protein
MPVGAQGVGKAEGVQTVVLVAGWRLAVAVSFGGLGIERKDGETGLQEPFHRRTAGGLDGKADDGRRSVGGFDRGEAGAQIGPALRRVVDAQFKDDAAPGIHHAQVVVALGPVHRAVVSECGINRRFGIGRGVARPTPRREMGTRS